MNAVGQEDRTRFLMLIGIFLLMGLPILMGYGVTPLTNFGVEVMAVVGLGVLLISSWRLTAKVRYVNYPLLVVVSLSVLLSIVLLLKAALGTSWALNEGTLLIYIGYVLGAAAATLVGYVLASSNSWEWTEKAVTRVLLVAAAIAAIGSLMQYLGIDGTWMGLSPSAEPGRTYGFVRQPNHQSTFLNIALAGLIFLRIKRNLHNVSWYLMVPILVMAIVTTGSRTGVVQLLVLLGLNLWVHRTYVGRAIWEVLLALIVSWLILYMGNKWLDVAFYGVNKVTQTSNEGLGLRGVMWQSTWLMIQERPWLGHVIHSFQPSFFLQGYAVEAMMVMENPHNMFLQMAFEFGVPMALALYAAILWLCISLMGNMSKNEGAQLVGGGVICILIHAQLEYPLWYSHFLFPFMFLVGIYLAALSLDAIRLPVKMVFLPPFARWLVTFSSLCFGAALIVAAITANRDFYKLTPLFTRFDSSSLAEKAEHAKDVFWFRNILDLSRYQASEVKGGVSKSERIELFGKLACERDEPWYQSSTLLLLAESGYMNDAKWLLFMMNELNPKSMEAVKRYMHKQSGALAADLYAFASNPIRVPISYMYFSRVCH